MRLFRSFARKLARPVGACLVVLAAWALLDRVVLTQAPAPAPPAGGTAPQRLRRRRPRGAPAPPRRPRRRSRRAHPVRAGSACGPACAAGSSDAGDRRDAAESAAWRLAPLATHVRRLGAQPADADQSRHREGPEGGVDVEPGFDRRRRQRVHAARARRRHVHVELRRDDSGARCENRHPALAIQPPAAGRLSVAAGLLQDEAEPRDRRQQAHRPDDRHACHRAGRQDGRQGVGCRHRRLQRACAPTTAARSSSKTRCSSAPATARRDTPIQPAGPTQESSRRADASSPATISRPGNNSGGSTRSRRPDEPGGDTWNNLPNEKRGGGAIWVVGQYDPELNLTYWGTGSPSPWSTVTRGTFDAKGLYMNSTLALNPDTGKLVWYYQHIGADPYDQDYAFERIVVPVNFQGRTPQGRDHRWQARDFRSRGCRDRPVPVRARSGCAERRHRDRSGDGSQDAAPRTTTRLA